MSRRVAELLALERPLPVSGTSMGLIRARLGYSAEPLFLPHRATARPGRLPWPRKGKRRRSLAGGFLATLGLALLGGALGLGYALFGGSRDEVALSQKPSHELAAGGTGQAKAGAGISEAKDALAEICRRAAAPFRLRLVGGVRVELTPGTKVSFKGHGPIAFTGVENRVTMVFEGPQGRFWESRFSYLSAPDRWVEEAQYLLARLDDAAGPVARIVPIGTSGFARPEHLMREEQLEFGFSDDLRSALKGVPMPEGMVLAMKGPRGEVGLDMTLGGLLADFLNDTPKVPVELVLESSQGNGIQSPVYSWDFAQWARRDLERRAPPLKRSAYAIRRLGAGVLERQESFDFLVSWPDVQANAGSGSILTHGWGALSYEGTASDSSFARFRDEKGRFLRLAFDLLPIRDADRGWLILGRKASLSPEDYFGVGIPLRPGQTIQIANLPSKIGSAFQGQAPRSCPSFCGMRC